MAEKLAAGQLFPSTTLTSTDGSSLSLPDGLGHGHKLILFFRGSW